MQNKILIIDDDRDLCNLLKKELTSENFEVTLCFDGKTGIETFLTNNYALVVLDIMLPRLNGMEVLNQIRTNNNVPVLMLTAKDSESDKVSGLRLGADDYLTKPFLINELIARVHSLVRRYTTFNTSKTVEAPLQFSGLIIEPATRIVTINNTEVHLTAKEFDLLYFLACNQGQVFTKEQIYNHVWKEEYAFDDSNVMSFISKLRKKVKNHNLEIDYIQTIHGIGYRFNKEV